MRILFDTTTSRRGVKHISPAQIILLGFAALILLGTFLLMLPIASQSRQWTGFADALFTATSATCVTGLVVHDTATYWSLFGQLVLLALIQIGGMGVVTVAVAFGIASGKKIGLRQRWIMQESLSAPQVGGIIRLTRFILTGVFAIEGIGAALLAIRFVPQFGPVRGLWYAVFHSISAFCNAGFDLMGLQEPYSSLTAYSGDPLLVLSITLLVIIGGIGFFTWADIRDHKLDFRRYSLQAKLILATTAALLLGGFAFYGLYELRRPEWAQLSGGEKLLAAWFQSVTMRTAGFNTIDLAAMSGPSQLVSIFLMLIGGSPSSTAGGLKTTTLAVLFLGVRTVFVHRSNAQCFHRRLPEDVLRNAGALLTLYLMLFLASGTAIACIDNLPLMDAMFETASAIGTVGLSLGVTPSLSAASHLILIALMYFGRMGGLTMIYAFSAGVGPERSRYPQERVTVG